MGFTGLWQLDSGAKRLLNNLRKFVRWPLAKAIANFVVEAARAIVLTVYEAGKICSIHIADVFRFWLQAVVVSARFKKLCLRHNPVTKLLCP